MSCSLDLGWVLQSHLAGMDFSGITSVQGNSMGLGSISVPWRVHRAEIILALGGFTSAFDVPAVVFKSLQDLQKAFKGYLKWCARSCFSFSWKTSTLRLIVVSWDPCTAFQLCRQEWKLFFFYYEEILTWSRGREREGQRGWEMGERSEEMGNNPPWAGEQDQLGFRIFNFRILE